MSMSEAITEFGFDCKIRKLSPKTITNYQKQLKYLQKYLGSEFRVKKAGDIKSFYIKQFLSMKDDQGRKTHYIQPRNGPFLLMHAKMGNVPDWDANVPLCDVTFSPCYSTMFA